MEAPERPLRSRRYGLVGRPDYLVQTCDGGKSFVVPVEVKSRRRPSQPSANHTLQLGRIVCWLRTTSARRRLTACCVTPMLRCRFPIQTNCADACWRRQTRSGRRAARRTCTGAMMSRPGAGLAAIVRPVGRRRSRKQNTVRLPDSCYGKRKPRRITPGCTLFFPFRGLDIGANHTHLMNSTICTGLGLVWHGETRLKGLLFTYLSGFLCANKRFVFGKILIP